MKHEQGSPRNKLETVEALNILNRHMLVYDDWRIVQAYAGAVVEKTPGNFNNANHVRDAIGHPDLPLIVRINPNVALQSKTTYFLCVIKKSTGEYLDENEIKENMVPVATFGKDGNLVEVSTHFTEDQAMIVFDHAQELAASGLLDEIPGALSS